MSNYNKKIFPVREGDNFDVQPKASFGPFGHVAAALALSGLSEKLKNTCEASIITP